MARPSTGNVRFDRRRKNPPFELRFQAYGNRKCVKLGTAEQGWTWDRAQRELENVLVEVRRGIWKPAEPEPEPAPVAEVPEEETPEPPQHFPRLTPAGQVPPTAPLAQKQPLETSSRV